MIDQELIQRVTSLPIHERLELIELLARSLNSNMKAAEDASESHNISQDSGHTMAAIEQLAASLGLRVPPDSAIHKFQRLWERHSFLKRE